MNAAVSAAPAERNRSALRRVAAGGGVIALALMGLVTLLMIGVEVGAVGFLTGVVVAAVPVPIYVALALFIDRFEPEPVRLLAWAFFWGATAAVCIALVLNTAGQAVVSSEFGSNVGELFGGSVSAPVVEESAKGIVLLGIYRWRRLELDGVLDGIVYAAMVGLGFAMTENILYYGKAAAGEDGVPLVPVFFLRGVLSPFAHPVFTAMTGIGVGLAVLRSSRLARFALPIAGLAGAMLLHSAWNTSASVEGGLAFFGVYMLIMVPIFIALLVVIVVSLRQEGKTVREQLEPEVAGGVLGAGDVWALGSIRERRRAVKAAERTGGNAGKRARKALHEAATELAFLRRRLERAGEQQRYGITQERERALRSRLIELRTQLPEGSRAAAPPVAPPAAAPPAAAPQAGGPPAAATPAGWYADPWGQSRLRYWDGRQWTPHTAA